MILAVDVHYQKDKAVVAGITFQNWQDRSPENEYVLQVENITAYVPGYFFRRELPCILKIISEYNLQPEIIVI
ncbi:MAG: endonuclease V, partial [Candidatus Cloacimonetes bacterium]|nr:endonuclease V [Candidatus Cloacimonadota bacterium]